MGRAPCCEKVGLKRGRWTAEEDDFLTKYVQANGEGLGDHNLRKLVWKDLQTKVDTLPQNRPEERDITPEEEEAIVKLHDALGNRWPLIAAQSPGRTDNEVNNYWNSHLSQKINRFTSQAKGEDPPLTISSVASVKKQQARRK